LAGEQRDSETRYITQHKLQSEEDAQRDQITIVILDVIINDDDKKEKQRDDSGGNKCSQELSPKRFLEGAQVISGEIINHQADERIDQERVPEIKSGHQNLSYPFGSSFIYYPPESQEAQPHQFATDEVSQDIS